jgi:hypothetical protein
VTAAAVVAAASCSAAPDAAPPRTEAVQARPAIRVAHVPPTAKDVIDAALASSGVPLKASANCTNVGTEPTDETIGRYLAGFLAELNAPDKKNWIETKVEPGRSPAGEPVFLCTLTLRHQDGDDRWGWGVRFRVRANDGLVLADSFECVGAG